MYPNCRLEDIVVSLELAKKLKENNIEYPTLFYWRIWDDGSIDCADEEDDFDYTGKGKEVVEEIPTYDVTILVDNLPASVKCDDKYFDLTIYKSDSSDGYVVQYERINNDKIDILQDFEGKRLVDILAKMRIWLEIQKDKRCFGVKKK